VDLPTAKSRAVSFRIAREEYLRLEAEARASNFRNPSDCARAKLMRAIGKPSLAEVASKLNEVEMAVQQLAQALREP
jgi:hypothetical protein